MTIDLLLNEGNFLHWLLLTDAGLLVRAAVGVAIFVGLAIVDVRRRGSEAKRWREYLFLLTAVIASMSCAVAIDLITSTISPEYFLYGKGLADVASSDSPQAWAFFWQVVWLAIRAGLTPGLIVGVLLLIANNPRKRRPQLPYSTLYRFVPPLLACSALAAVAGGAIGNAGMLTWAFDGFADAETAEILRRQSFMTAWGAHMGAYVGGALGVLTSVAMVLVFRKRLSNATTIKNE